jgi:hypothetical protein
VLTSSVLRPSGALNLSLGETDMPYLNIFGYNGYFQNMQIGGLGGSGTQMVICDNDGELSTDNVPSPVLGEISGILYTKTDSTAYSTTGSNQRAGDLITLSNAEYEGDADGTRLFRWTLGGKNGADMPGGVTFRFYLGGTLLFNFAIQNSSECNFHIQCVFSAYSSTLSRASVNLTTDDFGANAFTYDAITHGTGNNLSVYVDHSLTEDDNPYVYVYHQVLEVLNV